MAKQTEYFFHVGLGKTGSTYLQHRFFPKLRNIRYFHSSKYKKFEKYIDDPSVERYFFSREFDRQFEREVPRIHKSCPDAGIIIVLRRHDSWMASQYRRYVKNGGYKSFDEFFNLDGGETLWDIKDVYFYPKLEMLDQLFAKKPLVLFHDELKNNTHDYFDKIANYLGASYNKNSISLAKVHSSYNKKQLIIIRRLSRYLFNKKPAPPSNSAFINYVRFRSRWLLCHLILYVSLLWPKAWVNDEHIVSPESMQKVRDYFTNDWQQCIDYAKKVNA